MAEYINRKGTDSVKWDGLTETFGADDLLPLWVADMDFRIDRHIADAMKAYIDKGVAGYYKVPESFYEAFIRWERAEHGLDIKREWIRYSPGVVSGFNLALQMLTKPGDAVIITTPVYYPFMKAIENNGRALVCSELSNRSGRYYIDFEDFEKKIRDNSVRAFILCSPHNPVSRVWSEGEISRIMDICRRYDVALISDEIHHDIVFGSSVHIPTLSLAGADDRMIMFTSASKTFNIAGLRNSIVVIRNDQLRSEWDRLVRNINLETGDPLGYIAAEAAYDHGKPWLEDVKFCIYGNYEYLSKVFAEDLPEVVMTPLEATYLAWADFGAYLKPDEVQPFMQEKCGLAFDYGSWFGGDRSGSFIRINLATSRENITEMERRIAAALRH